ncbi:MAG: helix-turn-helix domain-containing protein [Collinsella sp.]|nr:helix-turn-helix domain-containing protein [Collinsella sp.]
MVISEQIKQGRKRLGMSQSELADAIWVSRNTIGNWENDITMPDVQSLVLMSALFGVSIDELVKGDSRIMAQALARDKKHLLIAETASPGTDRAEASDLSLFNLRTIGSQVYGKFENTDIAGAEGLAYRLVRAASFMSRSLYSIVDAHGRRVGSISRKHALHHPVYQVRMAGFNRVQIRREIRLDNGYRDVIRFDGEDVQIDGDLLGDEFAILRHGHVIARVHAHPALNRIAYGVELPDDRSSPLAMGIVLVIMMLRSYDCVWVRGVGRSGGVER